MSTYEISKSSLLSLKAEILKKQEELQKAKVENKIKLQREHQKPLELKNRGVEGRAANDGDDVDEDLLKKSRLALEAKSKLYDKLSKGSKNEEDKEFNRRYLVHFDKKAHRKSLDLPPADEEDDVDKYPQSEEEFNDNSGYLSDGEWVEFVDSFGRTRTCLKQDLAAFKAKDKEMAPIARESREKSKCRSRSRSRSHSPESQNDPALNNEEENPEFDEKSELLSGDMRRELMRQQWEREEELLKDKSDLHYQDILFSEARTHGVGYYGFSKDEDTRDKQQEALKKLRKETQRQQRLAQEVKQTREKQLAARIRAAKNRKRAREGLPEITSEDEEEERAEAAAQEAKEAKEKLEKEKATAVVVDDAAREISRQLHVRPWDIGKEGVDPVESARIRSGVRDPYDQDEWNKIQREKRIGEFAPPQAYHSDFAVSKRKREPINPYKRDFTPTPIRNECSESSSDDEADELLKDYAKSRGGNNIPPPATYDYYGPSASSKRRKPTPTDMEDAIMQGLKYFREKVEQTQPQK